MGIEWLRGILLGPPTVSPRPSAETLGQAFQSMPTPMAPIGCASTLRLAHRQTLPLPPAREGQTRRLPGDRLGLIGDSQAVLTGEALAALTDDPSHQAQRVKAYAKWGRSLFDTVHGVMQRDDFRSFVSEVDQVVVQLGGNDLNWRRADEILDDLRTLIDELHRIHPGIEVAVAEIPLRRTWLEENHTPEKAAEMQRTLEVVNRHIRGGGLEARGLPTNMLMQRCTEVEGPDCEDYQAHRYRLSPAEQHGSPAWYRTLARSLVQTFLLTPRGGLEDVSPRG